jgi:hypothetical protein
MRIMGAMKRDNHLDPDLFDLFVSSGVYRDYARRYLPAALIDDVDEAALFAIRPRPFAFPDADARRARSRQFLPEYRSTEPPRVSRLSTTRASLLPKTRRS